jgi:hypothetical protein
MKIHIEIETDNAAFEGGNAGREVSRILRELATKLEDWPGENEWAIGLRDFNGNKVGQAIAIQ